MGKIKVSRLFLFICLCQIMMCMFQGNVYAQDSRPDPLPAKPDTTLGDVQQHFSPDVYEEMPEELQEEADNIKMEDLLNKGISSKKIIVVIAVIIILLLTLFSGLGKTGRK